MGAGTLTTFGDYTFPSRQISLTDNFKNVTPRTVRLPGVDGGYSVFQEEAPPREVGNVSVTYWIEADSLADMQTSLDTLADMIYQGRQALFLQPIDSDESVRWCFAVVNNINAPFNADSISGNGNQYQQRVTVNFQVDNPVWFSGGAGTALAPAFWGGTDTWNNFNWAEEPPTVVVSGQSQFGTITVNGKIATQPRIVIHAAAAGTITDVSIQRIVSGAAQDYITFDGSISNGEVLEIDCRAASIKKDGADAFNTRCTFAHPAWIRLQPGSNNIKVAADGTADAGTVSIYYNEGYI